MVSTSMNRIASLERPALELSLYNFLRLHSLASMGCMVCSCYHMTSIFCNLIGPWKFLSGGPRILPRSFSSQEGRVWVRDYNLRLYLQYQAHYCLILSHNSSIYSTYHIYIFVPSLHVYVGLAHACSGSQPRRGWPTRLGRGRGLACQI